MSWKIRKVIRHSWCSLETALCLLTSRGLNASFSLLCPLLASHRSLEATPTSTFHWNCSSLVLWRHHDPNQVRWVAFKKFCLPVPAPVFLRYYFIELSHTARRWVLLMDYVHCAILRTPRRLRMQMRKFITVSEVGICGALVQQGPGKWTDVSSLTVATFLKIANCSHLCYTALSVQWD